MGYTQRCLDTICVPTFTSYVCDVTKRDVCYVGGIQFNLVRWRYCHVYKGTKCNVYSSNEM